MIQDSGATHATVSQSEQSQASIQTEVVFNDEHVRRVPDSFAIRSESGDSPNAAQTIFENHSIKILLADTLFINLHSNDTKPVDSKALSITKNLLDNA